MKTFSSFIQEATKNPWNAITHQVNKAGSGEGSHDWKSNEDHSSTVSAFKAHLEKMGHTHITSASSDNSNHTFLGSRNAKGYNVGHDIRTTSKNGQHHHELYSISQRRSTSA